MLISTTSIRSSINRTPADTTHIIYVSSDNTPLILAVAIVGGLLLILIIIVIVIAIMRLSVLCISCRNHDNNVQKWL